MAESWESTESAAEGENNKIKSSDEKRAWIWIMLLVNIVLLLLLMLLGIIALKVGNYLPEGTDIIFIVGKDPSVEVGDEEGKWQSGKNVNIFKANYVNGEGETTVVSQDGTKLIAPGTQSTYKFTMYNNGNMAVVYEIDLDFELKIGDKIQNEVVFPLKARLSTENGYYLIGDETEWVNVADATLSKHVSVLGARSYETFVLELLWEFDGGNDALDTMYGDASAEKGVKLTLGINTYAEEHIDSAATGGTRVDINEKGEHGGALRLLWIILLILIAAILIFYVSWLLGMRLKKDKAVDGEENSDGLDSEKKS